MRYLREALSAKDKVETSFFLDRRMRRPISTHLKGLSGLIVVGFVHQYLSRPTSLSLEKSMTTSSRRSLEMHDKMRLHGYIGLKTNKSNACSFDAVWYWRCFLR